MKNAGFPNEPTAKLINACEEDSYENLCPTTKPNQSHRKPTIGSVPEPRLEGCRSKVRPRRMPSWLNSSFVIGNWKLEIGNWQSPRASVPLCLV